MSKATKALLSVIIVTVIVCAAAFFLPLAGLKGNLDFHFVVVSSVLYTMLHIGAALLLLVGAGAYKQELRWAYIKIALGVVLAGVGLAQVVFITVFNLLETPWVLYGGVMLPFVAAGLLIYFGTRAMALLVGVRSLLTKRTAIFSFIVICLLVISFLPHKSAVLPETFFDVANAISVWDVVLYAASLGLVLQIKKRSGTYYSSSLGWLALSLFGSVAITTFVLAGTFISGQAPGGMLLNTSVIVGGFLYLMAGYHFAKTETL